MDLILLLLQLPLFAIACIILFTINGTNLLKLAKLPLTPLSQAIIGTTLGFVVFTLSSYILIWLNLNLLTIPLFAITALYWIIKKSKTLKHLPKFKPYLNFWLVVIFTLGIAGQLIIIAPSGYIYNEGLLFWSAHGHDGLWHVALIEQLKHGSFQNPVLSGEKLINYHFFSDIASAEFAKVFKFSSLDLYFRFFPLLYSILLGGSAYILARTIGGNFPSGALTLFFIYFSGSFGYIWSWLKSGSLDAETLFWATQIQSSIGNPPQIISNIIILTILLLLFHWFKKPNIGSFAVLTILLGTLPVFKVYASVVTLISLTLLSIPSALFIKDLKLFALTTTSSLLAAVLYLPLTRASTSFLIWEPWWFVRTMVVAKDKLDWIDLELRRQTYLAENNLKRVIFIEAISGAIFILGNLGTKIIGLIYLVKNFKSLLTDKFSLYTILIALTSLALPLLFLQKGVAGNTIQFMQYFLLIFCLWAGLSCAIILNSLKKLYLKATFILLFILLSIPTQVGLIWNNHLRPAYAAISHQELEALNFLKSLPPTTILTPPFSKDSKVDLSPTPIWTWSDTAYIPALTGLPTFLSDTEQVDIMGYNYSQRKNTQQQLFLEENPQAFQKLLQENNLTLIYFPTHLSPVADLNKTDLKLIFSNPSTQIWSLSKN